MSDSKLVLEMNKIISQNGTWGMYQMDERTSTYGLKDGIRKLDSSYILISKDDERLKPPVAPEQNVEFDAVLAKDLATKFFYWWYNTSGTNTQDGYDEWWAKYGQELIKGNNNEESQ